MSLADMNRREFVGSLAVGGLAAGTLLPMAAQAAWKPAGHVEVVVGNTPGSGEDITARMMQKVWQEASLVTTPTTIINKPGAGAALAWTYVNQHPNGGNYLTMASVLLLTNRINGLNQMRYTDLTALAILVGDEIVFTVYPGSTIKTGKDLIDRLKKDPASVPIATSGVGGQNSVALGLVAKGAGIDPTKLKVVGFTGAADAQTAVQGGHVEVLVSPASNTIGQIRAGALRAIGVASEGRLKGIMADLPPWREQGVDAVFTNWRGVFGPKNMPADAVAYWDGVLGKMVQQPGWLQQLDNAHLENFYHNAAQSKVFLAKQYAQVLSIMKTLGYAKVDD
ncbi:MAG TPA: tripartite tricarboxylate transporter substrate binding protein [Stellaceae bacterium]|nr:tripartite tricarboxylate transporter substrate binding protein [Stellaceae bacterium]